MSRPQIGCLLSCLCIIDRLSLSVLTDMHSLLYADWRPGISSMAGTEAGRRSGGKPSGGGEQEFNILNLHNAYTTVRLHQINYNQSVASLVCTVGERQRAWKLGIVKVTKFDYSGAKITC